MMLINVHRFAYADYTTYKASPSDVLMWLQGDFRDLLGSYTNIIMRGNNLQFYMDCVVWRLTNDVNEITS